MGSGGSSVKISLDKALQSSLSAVLLPPVAGLAYLFFQSTIILCTESAHLPFSSRACLPGPFRSLKPVSLWRLTVITHKICIRLGD